jgi:hypothetical protein
MKINREFSFASVERIHRVSPSPRASDQPQISDCLNGAHPNLSFDSLLEWRWRPEGEGVR